MRTLFPLLALALSWTSVSVAQLTTVEDFEDGLNEHAWAIGPSPAVIEVTGGNPGYYMREAFDFAVPQVRIGSVGSPEPFQGNYAARDVTQLAFDSMLLIDTPGTESRPLYLMLRFGQGTPMNPDDDYWACTDSGATIPAFGDGWVSYSFDITTTGSTVPTGWTISTIWSPTGPVPDWTVLMEDVASVFYFYGDPGQFYVEENWDIGVDNLSISEGGPQLVRADCNADGAEDISDPIALLAFLFASASAPPCEESCDANDDGSLDISDAVLILEDLFIATAAIPEPSSCGADPTTDTLSCLEFSACP